MTLPLPRVPVAVAVGAFALGLVLFAALLIPILLILDREAIHEAARTGGVDRVKQILDHKPSRLEQRDRLDLTPLLEAAWQGQTDVLRELIRRGADVNAKWDMVATGDGGWNALHIAALHGQAEAAEVLILAGTDVNARSFKGETPLDVATRNHSGKVADLLRAKGGVSGKAG